MSANKKPKNFIVRTWLMDKEFKNHPRYWIVECIDTINKTMSLINLTSGERTQKNKWNPSNELNNIYAANQMLESMKFNHSTSNKNNLFSSIPIDQNIIKGLLFNCKMVKTDDGKTNVGICDKDYMIFQYGKYSMEELNNIFLSICDCPDNCITDQVFDAIIDNLEIKYRNINTRTNSAEENIKNLKSHFKNASGSYFPIDNWDLKKTYRALKQIKNIGDETSPKKIIENNMFEYKFNSSKDKGSNLEFSLIKKSNKNNKGDR